MHPAAYQRREAVRAAVWGRTITWPLVPLRTIAGLLKVVFSFCRVTRSLCSGKKSWLRRSQKPRNCCAVPQKSSGKVVLEWWSSPNLPSHTAIAMACEYTHMYQYTRKTPWYTNTHTLHLTSPFLISFRTIGPWHLLTATHSASKCVHGQCPPASYQLNTHTYTHMRTHSHLTLWPVISTI